MTAWLPFPRLVDHADRVGMPLPVAVYSGIGRVPPAPELVKVYVLPHPFVPASLDVLNEMSSLSVLQVLSSGVDHVLPRVPAGVVVCNAPNLHARPTAEVGMALMLASLNHVPEWVIAQEQRVWRDPGPRPGLAGRTVLLVGYGAVGQALAAMLAGFDVRLIPVARHQRPGVAGIDRLPSLISEADVVVIAAPLTAQTRGLIGDDLLGRMRDGALLINISRGPLVDCDALLKHVKAGRVRAALDVTDPEPLPADHPLWTCPDVVISPHVGGNMADFQQRAETLVAEQLRRYAGGLPLLNVVSSS